MAVRTRPARFVSRRQGRRCAQGCGGKACRAEGGLAAEAQSKAEASKPSCRRQAGRSPKRCRKLVAAAAVVDLPVWKPTSAASPPRRSSRVCAAMTRRKAATEEATQTLQGELSPPRRRASGTREVKAPWTGQDQRQRRLRSPEGLATAKEHRRGDSAARGEFLRTQGEAAGRRRRNSAELAKKTADETAAPIQAQMKKVLQRGLIRRAARAVSAAPRDFASSSLCRAALHCRRRFHRFRPTQPLRADPYGRSAAIAQLVAER